MAQDNDEDWEDDFGDFQAKAASSPNSNVEAVTDEEGDDSGGDFGSFTQVDMIDGDKSSDEAASPPLPAATTTTTTLQQSTPQSSVQHNHQEQQPVVETINEFSQSSAIDGDDIFNKGTDAAVPPTQDDFNMFGKNNGPEPEKVESSAASPPPATAKAEASPADMLGEFDNISFVENNDNNETAPEEADDHGDFAESAEGVNKSPSPPPDPALKEIEPSLLDHDLEKNDDDGHNNNNNNNTDSADTEDDSGGFSQIPSVEENAAPADGNVMNNDNDNNHDFFGDFANPRDEAEKPADAQSSTAGDPFGDFDGIDNNKIAATPPAIETVEDNSESFGDFGAAPVTQAIDSPEIPTAAIEDEKNDPFGDFDDKKDKEATSDEPPRAEHAVMETVDNSESFGDFGEAAPVVAEVPAAAASSSSEAMEPVKTEVDEIVDNSESFGDFGEAPVISESSPGEKSATVTETLLNGEVDQPHKADDFGDFGEAQVTAKTVPEVSGNSSDEKDDFGDFGEVSSAAIAAPSEVPTATVQDSDTDDDFGDFAEVAPGVSANSPGDDDDDFGDFGEAVAEATTAAPGVHKGADGGQGEDDDFGDFAEVAPAAATEEDDGFGDFNDVEETDAPPKPTQATPSTSQVSDPILQPVHAAMNHMFRQPHVAESQSEDTDECNETEKLSVTELMESLRKSESQEQSSDELPSVWDLITQSGLLRKSEPQLITTGKPPHRIHYPLHGFTSLYETKKPPEVKTPLVPAVLDVQLQARQDESSSSSSSPATLASGNAPKADASNTPASAPSPAPSPVGNSSARSPPAATLPANGLVVQLPPKKSVTDTTSKADSFLKKIPDLSYMLSSKLSLPTQS